LILAGGLETPAASLALAAGFLFVAMALMEATAPDVQKTGFARMNPREAESRV